MSNIEEGGVCPEPQCDGHLILPPVEGCSCHVSAPCSACTSNPLTCDSCGWEAPEPEPEQTWPDTTVQKSQPNPWWEEYQRRRKEGHRFAHGGRIFEYDYDSSSGSTMVYRGRYEGPVTTADIIEYLGDGTFGHRGPTLTPYQDAKTGRPVDRGTFIYTKITD